MNDNIKNTCGDIPENYSPQDLISDPNYIFQNDPSYSAVQLWDIDSNTVFVNSFIECKHYFEGGWSFNPTIFAEQQYQIYGVVFLISTFFLIKIKDKIYNDKK
jgi:hypothetical protein